MENREECVVLLDNGSLRPDSVLSLRKLAKAFGERIGHLVNPVSLLHSSKIPSEDLGGVEAHTWRRFFRLNLEEGVTKFRIVPLFFGPSSAIADYLPKVSSEVMAKHGSAELVVCRTLVDPEHPEDDSVARLLRELLIRCLNTNSDFESLRVIMVDHGSPLRVVAECRDRVASQLAGALGIADENVVAASMERRGGEEYAFNEPLLESALDNARELGWREVVLSQLFFSPGRHAGPGGDIRQIVAESPFVSEGGSVRFSPLVSESPALVDLLKARYLDSFSREQSL